MKDPVLSNNLSSKEKVSNKLPERYFFFGLLCTLRKHYMLDIITDASKKRFKIEDDNRKKAGILIPESEGMRDVNSLGYVHSIVLSLKLLTVKLIDFQRDLALSPATKGSIQRDP